VRRALAVTAAVGGAVALLDGRYPQFAVTDLLIASAFVGQEVSGRPLLYRVVQALQVLLVVALVVVLVRLL
jgi:hypothetical protein